MAHHSIVLLALRFCHLESDKKRNCCINASAVLFVLLLCKELLFLIVVSHFRRHSKSANKVDETDSPKTSAQQEI